MGTQQKPTAAQSAKRLSPGQRNAHPRTESKTTPMCHKWACGHAQAPQLRLDWATEVITGKEEKTSSHHGGPATATCTQGTKASPCEGRHPPHELGRIQVTRNDAAAGHGSRVFTRCSILISGSLPIGSQARHRRNATLGSRRRSSKANRQSRGPKEGVSTGRQRSTEKNRHRDAIQQQPTAPCALDTSAKSSAGKPSQASGA